MKAVRWLQLGLCRAGWTVSRFCCLMDVVRFKYQFLFPSPRLLAASCTLIPTYVVSRRACQVFCPRRFLRPVHECKLRCAVSGVAVESPSNTSRMVGLF